MAFIPFSITIDGDEAIKKAFRDLPPKLAKKVIKKSLTRNLKIVQEAARALAPVDTGAGRKSLRVRASFGPKGTNRREVIAIALLVGEAMGPTWYMWLQENGWTSGRRIRSGGKVTGRVGTSHKIRGKRFMKRALVAHESEVKVRVVNDILSGIEHEAHGGIL